MTESRKTKILVVDDAPHVCELLCDWLRAEGYECTMAFNGEEALRALKGDTFDLLLSDILMPGMSGIDLLQIMRPLFPDVPVIMATAVDDGSTGILAEELGACGYVIKPFNRNEILTCVAGVLERRREKQDDRRHPSALGARAGMEAHKSHPMTVSASQAVYCIGPGMDDASLMERFDLSTQALQRLLEHLLASGKLKQSEVDERKSRSPGSVVTDMGQQKFLGTSTRRPLPSAADALSCIRSGMDDFALMTRYDISPKDLPSLFGKLLAAGIIGPSELENRMPLAISDIVPSLETTLDDLKRARRWKKELKRLIKNLIERYRVAKREEEMHKKRARTLLQEREYSGYLDTIITDKPSE
ncbi:MAG: response regulator [Desulfomonilaceae bacterium]